MTIQHRFKRSFRQFMVERRAKKGQLGAELSLLRRCNIDVVLDVGANRGQYAKNLIRSGFGGRIISFEPLPDAFEILQSRSQKVPGWDAVPLALSSQAGEATLNIAGNSDSSSMHPMLQRHLQSAPESKYVDSITVQKDRLDKRIDQWVNRSDRTFLKIDVQGHELEVLEGSKDCFDRIVGLEIELSLVPLYEGQILWQEMIQRLDDQGFVLASIDPCFVDPETGGMLQADGRFIRRGIGYEHHAAA